MLVQIKHQQDQETSDRSRISPEARPPTLGLQCAPPDTDCTHPSTHAQDRGDVELCDLGALPKLVSSDQNNHIEKFPNFNNSNVSRSL